MTLRQFLQGEKSPQYIKVKVLETHDEKSIVGDTTALAICHNSNSGYKEMKEGLCYQMLKPTVLSESEFIPNEKLKPIKINNFSVTPKKGELAKLQSMMPSKSEAKPFPSQKKNDKQISFKDIGTLPNKTEIKSITAKVITLSKDISGAYGKYCIGKLKDIACEKMDINIYNMRLRQKIAVGDIVELKNLKLTEFIKDGQSQKRFVTTSQTTVDKCDTNTEATFKEVPLGDKREGGKVVAIHDIFTYLSCPNCWKKVVEDATTSCCGNTIENATNDFHCQFYIELTKDNFIEVVHTFRRQTGMTVQSLVHDDIQKLLDETFVQKTFIFEWNIVDGDDEQLRMIKIENPEEQ